jgi:hypothetical protein
MGFYTNEETTTKLHYKDICLIAMVMGEYQERYKDTAEPEILNRMKNLVNRLGCEMHDNPDNDKPNGH